MTEDRCRFCNKWLGFGIEALHVGICEDCARATYRPDHNGECLNCDEPFDGHAADGRCLPPQEGSE